MTVIENKGTFKGLSKFGIIIPFKRNGEKIIIYTIKSKCFKQKEFFSLSDLKNFILTIKKYNLPFKIFGKTKVGV